MTPKPRTNTHKRNRNRNSCRRKPPFPLYDDLIWKKLFSIHFLQYFSFQKIYNCLYFRCLEHQVQGVLIFSQRKRIQKSRALGEPRTNTHNRFQKISQENSISFVRRFIFGKPDLTSFSLIYYLLENVYFLHFSMKLKYQYFFTK